MAMTTSAPIKQAIVHQLRLSAPLVAASTGGIHWRVAPREVKYPYIVVSLVSAPLKRDWDQVEIRSVWDIVAFAVNSVEVEQLDALVTTALNEADLPVTGQTTLLCQRVADVPGDDDIDDTGTRIFQMGGSYSIWTTQPR